MAKEVAALSDLRGLLVEANTEFQSMEFTPTEELYRTDKLVTEPAQPVGNPTALREVALTTTPVHRSALVPPEFGARAMPILRLRFSALKPVASVVTTEPTPFTVAKEPPTPMNTCTPVSSIRRRSNDLDTPPIDAVEVVFSRMKLPTAIT